MLLSVVFAVAVVPGVIAADAEEAPPPPPVRTEAADALSVAGLKAKEPWLVVTDPLGDIVDQSGTPIPKARPAIELIETWITRARVNAKMLKAIKKGKLRDDKRGRWHGSKLNLKKGDEVLIVALRTKKKANVKRAADAQIMVLFDGAGGVPAQVGPGAGIYTGFETVSMGGGFPGGGWLSGDSSLTEYVPGADIELFNTRSKGVGVVDKAAGAMVHITPIPEGATSLTAALRLDSGGMYDVLTLPGGGAHIGLDDGPWSVRVGDDAVAPATPPYTCQRAELLDAPVADVGIETDDSVLRITYGVESLAGLADTDTTPLKLIPVGADDAPRIVDAAVEQLVGTSGVRVSAPVPPGRWIPVRPQQLFDAGLALQAASGPDRFDALYGGAGVLVEAGQRGLLAGDARCATWDVVEDACAAFPSDVVADAMGIESSLITGNQFADDGALLCFAIDEATQQTAFVAGLDIEPASTTVLDAEAAEHACPSSDVGLGTRGILIDCADDGFASYRWVTTPDPAADSGAIDGLRASFDINVGAVAADGGFDREVVLDALAAWGAAEAARLLPAA